MCSDHLSCFTLLMRLISSLESRSQFLRQALSFFLRDRENYDDTEIILDCPCWFMRHSPQSACRSDRPDAATKPVIVNGRNRVLPPRTTYLLHVARVFAHLRLQLGVREAFAPPAHDTVSDRIQCVGIRYLRMIMAKFGAGGPGRRLW